MGNAYSLSYVNLFMAQFEEQYIYPEIKDISLIFKIYWWHIYHMEGNKRRINNIYERTE